MRPRLPRPRPGGPHPRYPELSSFGGHEATFGEQLLVAGAAAKDLCVGDRFEAGTLRLEVTMPRLACIRVDKRHPLGKQSGTPGTVRQWGSSTGACGFFCKVLEPGHLEPGDVLIRTKRPRPAWTLRRLSELCYPETPLRLTWKGTRGELAECLRLSELGVNEWADRLPSLDAVSPADLERGATGLAMESQVSEVDMRRRALAAFFALNLLWALAMVRL